MTVRLAWLGLAWLMCGSVYGAPESKGPTVDRCWSKAKELFGDALAERSAVDKKVHGQPPKVLKRANPSFPEHVKVPQQSCLHLLHEALVSPSGDVVAVWLARRNLAEACPEFDNAAVAAIKQWKYSPLLLGQRAVPFCLMVSTTIDVR